MEGKLSCLQCSPNETTSGEGSNSSAQCGGVYLRSTVSVCCLLYQTFEIHVYLSSKEMHCNNNPRERLPTDNQSSPSCASDWLKAVVVTGVEIWALTLPHIMGRWYRCRIRCYYIHQFKLRFGVVSLFSNYLGFSIHIYFWSIVFHSSMPGWIIFINWTGSMFFMRSTVFSAAQWESDVFFMPGNNYNTETRIKELTRLHR